MHGLIVPGVTETGVVVASAQVDLARLFLSATSSARGHGPDEIHAAFIRAYGDFSNLSFMRDDPLAYTIEAGAHAGTVLIKLIGPLTLTNMFTFQGELRTLQPAVTIFDLTESDYMDSAGLGVLVNFYTSAAKNGRRMALAGVNERIEALLDMTHVKSLLRVYPTVHEAEAAA